MTLEEVIKASTFKVENGMYVYAKVKTAPPVDEHFLVTKDENEITVVTREENLEKLDLIERNKENYKLIPIFVATPFYAVGFLAAISNAISKQDANILIVSTYSVDYIMVIEEKLEQAKKALMDLGFQEK